MDAEIIKRVLAAFESRGVEYVIFGAVALNLHGLARATEDLDVFIAAEEANVDRLKLALRDVFDDPEIDSITALDLLGEIPGGPVQSAGGAFRIDIVTRLGEAFRFADLELERVPFQDLTVNVVSPRTLFIMKKDTVRPQDRADAEILRRRFNLEQG